MIDEVMRFTDHHLNDDLALLALKRLKSGREAPTQERVDMSGA